MGFEPTTASLEGWNSTTELRPQSSYNHSCYSPGTNVLPKNIRVIFSRFLQHSSSLPYFSYNPCIHNLLGMVGRQGFEPWKPMAADLQSAPVDHLGTCPFDQCRAVFYLNRL